jgi:hypothetical protein
MHHTWNALIINKESGLVRMFQAEESLPPVHDEGLRDVAIRGFSGVG